MISIPTKKSLFTLVDKTLFWAEMIMYLGYGSFTNILIILVSSNW